MLADSFRVLARYNQWMNKRLYDCAARMDPQLLGQDQGAFFGSVLGTFNHLMVADVLWMQRLARHPLHFASLDYLRDYPTPTALNQLLHTDLAALRADREQVDAAILALTNELDETLLQSDLHYQDTRGNTHSNSIAQILQHVFNHQTHHRGQATTLFNQNGIDVGVTDLMIMMRES